MIGVGDRQQQRIAEYRHRFIECHAVLAKIARGLRFVLFELVGGHPTGAFSVRVEISMPGAIRNADGNVEPSALLEASTKTAGRLSPPRRCSDNL